MITIWRVRFDRIQNWVLRGYLCYSSLRSDNVAIWKTLKSIGVLSTFFTENVVVISLVISRLI